jgi:hypothetical protein
MSSGAGFGVRDGGGDADRDGGSGGGVGARDRGSAAVLLVVSASTVAVAAAVAVGSMIVDLVDASRARTAADAAALGSVRGGQAMAAALSSAHGATLLDWHRDGDDVVVRVRVGDATATARATNAP